MTEKKHAHALIALARLHTDGLTHVAELAKTSRSNLLGMIAKDNPRAMPARVKSELEAILGFDETGFSECYLESWLARSPSDITQLLDMGFRLKPIGRLITTSEQEGRQLYQYLVLQLEFENTARFALVRMTLNKVDDLLKKIGRPIIREVFVPNGFGKPLMKVHLPCTKVQDGADVQILLERILDFAAHWQPSDELAKPTKRSKAVNQIHANSIVSEIYSGALIEEEINKFTGCTEERLNLDVNIKIHKSSEDMVSIPWRPDEYIVVLIVYPNDVFQIAYAGPIYRLLEKTEFLSDISRVKAIDMKLTTRNTELVQLSRLRELGASVRLHERLLLRA